MCMCLCLSVYHLCAGAHGGEKRAVNPLELKWPGTWCGCWELNSGPLKEQQVILTTEPPFQTDILPATMAFHLIFWDCFLHWPQGSHLARMAAQWAPHEPILQMQGITSSVSFSSEDLHSGLYAWGWKSYFTGWAISLAVFNSNRRHSLSIHILSLFLSPLPSLIKPFTEKHTWIYTHIHIFHCLLFLFI